VQAEDRDPASLLNLYRRLIHLRRENEALASGTLVRLSSGGIPDVVAYLRRSGAHAVMVVANLGNLPLVATAVASPAHALAPGRYAAHSLLGGPDGAALEVLGDGRIPAYVPAPMLGPHEVLVLDISRR